MSRLPLYLAVFLLLTAGAAVAACGQKDPSPEAVLDQTLTPAGLSGRSLDGAVVRVQSLGNEDRILKERTIAVPPEALAEFRRGLADAGEGFRDLVRDLDYSGKSEVAGRETDHLSGSLDLDGLKEVLGEDGVSGLLDGAGDIGGNAAGPDAAESVLDADFDLYSDAADREMRRLDLTFSLGDPDNALPPIRIRFSLSGESASQSSSP